MPRFRMIVVLVITLTATLVAGQRTAPKPSAADGISWERLKRLDALLQEHVDQNRIAGIVTLVLRDGKPVYEKAVGWSDKEARRPMTNDTIFRIASQTKAITSVAILSLMEEGKIGLNDPVSRFIPSFAKTTVAVASDTGVLARAGATADHDRDLLTHTAGISYGTDASVAPQYEAKGLGPAAGFGWYTADKDEPICVTMERLATLPFVAQPGEAWVYGYNTDILGCVVEQASGMPLDEFIRTRITDAARHEGHAVLPACRPSATRLAAVYSSGSNGTISRAPDGPRGQGHYVDGPRKSFAGGAGLLSTARDYARFLEMIRNGGALDGVRILSPRTVASDDDQPGRHAALDDRPWLRLRLRDDRSLRREWAGVGGRLSVGRRLRLELPRRSGCAPRDGLHDSADSEPPRLLADVSGAGLSGAE